MKFLPFRRSKPVVMLDEDSLDRAIRAGVQFPLDWFLQQPPEVQETIALRRDLWLEDLVVAAGYAVLDPERTRLGLLADAGDEEAEATLATLNAHAIAKMMGQHAAREDGGEPNTPERPKMGGLGKRRKAAAEERAAQKPNPFGAKGVG